MINHFQNLLFLDLKYCISLDYLSYMSTGFQLYPSWITPPSSLSFLAPNLLTCLVNISFGRLGDLVNALEKVSGSSISCSCANSSSADKAVKAGGEAGRGRIGRIVLVQNTPDCTRGGSHSALSI